MVGRSPTEGASRALVGRHDVLVAATLGSTTATVYAVTSEGRALTVLAADIGEVAGRSRGSAAAQRSSARNRGEDILTVVVPGERAARAW